MTRKIIASAIAALAIGTFTAAPRVAEAFIDSAVSVGPFDVTAEVPSTTTVSTPSTVDFGQTYSGTASATAQKSFGLTVTSNDADGYQFSFVGSGVNNAYTLAGTASGNTSTLLTYTISTDGGGSTTYGPTVTTPTITADSTTGHLNTFYINILAHSTAVLGDTYSGTITATIQPQ